MTELLLEATGVEKRYGAVTALRDASLSVRPGEIHALMGANGAGKSTLVKILTGAVEPDAGTIRLRGQDRAVHSPAEARRTGMVSVYQEPAIIPDLDDRREPRPDRDPDRARSASGSPISAFAGLDLRVPARDLPLATLRVVDLARALAIEPDVLLLDEMTAALPADLTARVLEVVAQPPRDLALGHLHLPPHARGRRRSATAPPSCGRAARSGSSTSRPERRRGGDRQAHARPGGRVGGGRDAAPPTARRRRLRDAVPRLVGALDLGAAREPP